MIPQPGPVLSVAGVSKSFHRENGELVHALSNVSCTAFSAAITAFVGPDGAGKTTLLRLACGLMNPEQGVIQVLGIDVAREPQRVQSAIGYMPQRFGLYEDLSVLENLDLYANLHGLSANDRRERYPRLFEMTALGAFKNRLAGRLSGGMKQKLGLACTLVRSPGLLLLDEPTVGVDPLSRRELWQIMNQLVAEESLAVVVSTSYLDEAERCNRVVVFEQGHVLAEGPAAEVTALARDCTYLVDPGKDKARNIQARMLNESDVVDAVPDGGIVRVVYKPGRAAQIAEDSLQACIHRAVEPRFEDGFMVLLRQAQQRHTYEEAHSVQLSILHAGSQDTVVSVKELTRRFGNFTAVDTVSFEVRRGEIFGLLGPNGAGKTTTFRMLCGLLPATSGTLIVAGTDVRLARASARGKIGYVAQKFSLYGQLSVLENLEFFASAYGLRGARRAERIAWALDHFELRQLARVPSGQLPGGYKQRMSMAAALLHEPEILFLDEPTSGADTLARRDFWRRITLLSEQGVTTIITTHFMEEAEYCDRIVILDSGRVLAQGTPAAVRKSAGSARTMEDAFISIVATSRVDQAGLPGVGNVH